MRPGVFRSIFFIFFSAHTAFAGAQLERLAKKAQSRWTTPGQIRMKIRWNQQRDAIYQSGLRLAQFLADGGSHYVVPEEFLLNITRGAHYLEAACFPFDDIIQIDESAWAAGLPVADGLLAHEAGHMIFKHSVEAMLSDQLRWEDNVSFERLAQTITSDSGAIDRIMRSFDKTGSLARAVAGDTDEVSPDEMGLYLFLKDLKRAYEQGQPREQLKILKGSELIKYQMMNEMAGLQEVFADFVGVVYTHDPSYLTKILRDPVSKYVRDFKARDFETMSMDTRRKILTSASKGVPHVLLILLRQQLYHQFYEKIGVTPGQNEAYDKRVLQTTLESMFNQYVKVTVQKDPPRTMEAAATMPLIFRRIVAGMLEEIEVKVRGFVTEYRLVRYEKVELDLTALHEACAREVAQNQAQQAVSPRLQRFRERRSGEQQQQQQMRYRQGGSGQ